MPEGPLSLGSPGCVLHLLALRAVKKAAGLAVATRQNNATSTARLRFICNPTWYCRTRKGGRRCHRVLATDYANTLCPLSLLRPTRVGLVILTRAGLGKRFRKPYDHGCLCSRASPQGRRRISVDGIEKGRGGEDDCFGGIGRRDGMFKGRIGVAVEDVLADRPEDDIERELCQAALGPGPEDRVRLRTHMVHVSHCQPCLAEHCPREYSTNLAGSCDAQCG